MVAIYEVVMCIIGPVPLLETRGQVNLISIAFRLEVRQIMDNVRLDKIWHIEYLRCSHCIKS